MTSIELQLQEIISNGKNVLSAVTALGTPPVVNLQPVLDAIAAIKVTAPEVDFTPVLTAIAAIPAAPVADLTPVLEAVAAVATTATEIDSKIGTLVEDSTDPAGK